MDSDRAGDRVDVFNVAISQRKQRRTAGAERVNGPCFGGTRCDGRRVVHCVNHVSRIRKALAAIDAQRFDVGQDVVGRRSATGQVDLASVDRTGGKVDRIRHVFNACDLGRIVSCRRAAVECHVVDAPSGKVLRGKRVVAALANKCQVTARCAEPGKQHSRTGTGQNTAGQDARAYDCKIVRTCRAVDSDRIGPRAAAANKINLFDAAKVDRRRVSASNRDRTSPVIRAGRDGKVVVGSRVARDRQRVAGVGRVAVDLNWNRQGQCGAGAVQVEIERVVTGRSFDRQQRVINVIQNDIEHTCYEDVVVGRVRIEDQVDRRTGQISQVQGGMIGIARIGVGRNILDARERHYVVGRRDRSDARYVDATGTGTRGDDAEVIKIARNVVVDQAVARSRATVEVRLEIPRLNRRGKRRNRNGVVQIKRVNVQIADASERHDGQRGDAVHHQRTCFFGGTGDGDHVGNVRPRAPAGSPLPFVAHNVQHTVAGLQRDGLEFRRVQASATVHLEDVISPNCVDCDRANRRQNQSIANSRRGIIGVQVVGGSRVKTRDRNRIAIGSGRQVAGLQVNRLQVGVVQSGRVVEQVAAARADRSGGDLKRIGRRVAAVLQVQNIAAAAAAIDRESIATGNINIVDRAVGGSSVVIDVNRVVVDATVNRNVVGVTDHGSPDVGC